nr:hypothetical protein Iba_chr12dCG6720 [Ipomoea batatas]
MDDSSSCLQAVQSRAAEKDSHSDEGEEDRLSPPSAWNVGLVAVDCRTILTDGTHQVDGTTSFTNHKGRSIPIAQSATNRPGNPNQPTLMPQIPQNQICHSMLHRNVPNPQFSVPVTKPLVKKVEKPIEEVVIIDSEEEDDKVDLNLKLWKDY